MQIESCLPSATPKGRFDLFSKLRIGTEVIATFPRARVMDALAPAVEKKNRLQIYSDAR
jgi:two-component system cell cycle sensor histidine kinase PleC